VKRLLILFAPLVLLCDATAYAAPTPILIPSAAETVPVTHRGDTADDPTIWVNKSKPAQSRIIANDKKGALNMYRLDGSLVASLRTGTFWGNSDVRGNLLAVAQGGIKLFSVSKNELNRVGAINTSGEGLCMYKGPTALYVFIVTRPGFVRQFKVNAAHTGGTLVRSFNLGSEGEGCAVDDNARALYISQEDVALWRYGADPGDGARRVAVDTVIPDGRIARDAEGVAVSSNRVIVSAQYRAASWKSYFTVYTRGNNEYVGAFRVSKGVSSDDCDQTDGISAYAGYLGQDYPFGLFVCQDGNNTAPGSSGRQDFKLVPWEALP
jgi:myo-inositol-hexaphosphate 3-phosphohydrolase